MGENWPGPIHMVVGTGSKEEFTNSGQKKGRGQVGTKYHLQRHTPHLQNNTTVWKQASNRWAYGDISYSNHNQKNPKAYLAGERGWCSCHFFYLRFPGPKFIASRSALEFTGSHFNQTYFDHEANSGGVRTKKMSLLSVLLILHH